MAGNRIAIMVETAPERCPHEMDTIEDKVEAACDLIDSGHESRHEWNLIRKLNNELVRRKQMGRLGKRGEKLLEMMAHVINKYGNEDPRGVEFDPENAMR
jgi:hypothetical protein